jgi:hypothetical protein
MHGMHRRSVRPVRTFLLDRKIFLARHDERLLLSIELMSIRRGLISKLGEQSAAVIWVRSVYVAAGEPRAWQQRSL